MQFLTNKMNFAFCNSQTNAARAEAYSPFATHIQDIENKRSKLFPDRLRVPGRKTKYILAIAYLVHLYSLMKLIQAKKVNGIRNQEQLQMNRKAAPFFHSIEDVQYTILKHRWDLMTKEVLGQDFLKKQYFHNPDIAWKNMFQPFYGWARSGMGRYNTSIFNRIGWNFANGYEIKSI